MKSVTILLLFVGFSIVKANAQFVVSDPMHTGITSLIKLIQDPSFKTMVKQIEGLKKVGSAVQQFHRGKEIIQSISNTTSKLKSLGSALSFDGHIYSGEYGIIAKDIINITKAGTSILKDMKSVTTEAGSVLKMSDGERTKWLNETYARVASFENGVNRYINFIKNQSIRRSGNKYDLQSTTRLYNAVYQASNYNSYEDFTANISGSGYDSHYSNDSTSILDNYQKNKLAEELQRKMLECQRNQQNFYDELAILEIQMEDFAMTSMLIDGYSFKWKKLEFNYSSVNPNYWAQVNNPTANTDGTSTSGSAVLSGGGGGTWGNFSEDAEGFLNPNGMRITKEEFSIRMRMKARELQIPKEEALRQKWKLEDCLKAGYNG